jgi:acyl-CoA thioesterase
VIDEFEAATEVRLRGGGMYDSHIAAGWDIAGNANGGYLMALAARAMSDSVGRPPLSVTTHFLTPGLPGPCEIDVDVHRSGKRMATVAARLISAGEAVVSALGLFADQVPGGPIVNRARPPELPPIEQCVRRPPPAQPSGFGDRVDVRVRPADAGFYDGRPSGEAEVCGWFSMADGARIDVIGLLLAADAFAPVVFNQPEFPQTWAPTLELTVQIRGVPAPGPIRCRFIGRYMQNGLFEEDGELWDSNGYLVALSRQLALSPRI